MAWVPNGHTDMFCQQTQQTLVTSPSQSFINDFMKGSWLSKWWWWHDLTRIENLEVTRVTRWKKSSSVKIWLTQKCEEKLMDLMTWFW